MRGGASRLLQRGTTRSLRLFRIALSRTLRSSATRASPAIQLWYCSSPVHCGRGVGGMDIRYREGSESSRNYGPNPSTVIHAYTLAGRGIVWSVVLAFCQAFARRATRLRQSGGVAFSRRVWIFSFIGSLPRYENKKIGLGLWTILRSLSRSRGSTLGGRILTLGDKPIKAIGRVGMPVWGCDVAIQS